MTKEKEHKDEWDIAEKPYESGADETSEMDKEELEEIADEKEVLDAIRKYTDEEDSGIGKVTLSSIFGGDILQSKFVRKQVMWFLLVALLMVVYTANRYQSQQEIITIDSLKNELQGVKYNVLTQSSELMNMSRQSHVEHYLKQSNDSELSEPTTPPYLIRINPDDNVQ